MSYYFANKAEGKVEITDEQNNTYTLKQINSTSNQSTAADSIMGGLSTMLDIVGWEVNDVVRVVNQDVVEGEDPSGSSKRTATLALTDMQTIPPSDQGSPTITGVVSYDGDGVIYTTQTHSSVANGTTLSFSGTGSRDYYVLYANATANYSAAVLEY